MRHGSSLARLLLLCALLLLTCSTRASLLLEALPGSEQHDSLIKDVALPDQLPDAAAAALNSATAAPGLTAEDVEAAKFDFWILALFWPPSVVPVAAQSRARHAVIRQEARSGFWTHGL